MARTIVEWGDENTCGMTHLPKEGRMLSATYAPDNYLSGNYRGHHYAIMQHHRVWRVFLDYRLLERCVFATAEDATRWLYREIDASVK